MATLHVANRADDRAAAVVIRSVAVSLTLATAAIHASLGGLLFTLNAIGYATLAIAMIAPGPIGQVRWLIRLALIGFTATTIGGWVLFGARFPLAYIDKAIEVALIAVLAFELWQFDGGLTRVMRRGRQLLTRLGAVLARA